MAPKKRLRVGSSSQQQPAQQHQQQPLDPRYINREAEAAARKIDPRPIIKERTMEIVHPQRAYIDSHRWTAFVQAGTTPASRCLVQEFYSNLVGRPDDLVFVRGKEVDASAEAINEIYGLPNIPGDGYSAITQQEPTLAQVAAALTEQINGQHPVLLPDWRNIARGLLTVEAKNWAYFVSARMIPVSMGSEIHKVRALLTYAIVTGRTVDVGRVIRREMRFAGLGRANRSLGFPSLITQLCIKAGVDVTPTGAADEIQPHPRITADMYLPAQKARRRLRAVESDAEDDHEAEHLHQGGGQQDQGGQDEQMRGDQEDEEPLPQHQTPAGPVYLEPQIAFLYAQMEAHSALMRDQMAAQSALMTAQYEQLTATMQQQFSALSDRVTAFEQQRRSPPPPP